MAKDKKKASGGYVTRCPGLSGFHQTLSNRDEKDNPKRQQTHEINAALNGVRNEVQSLFAAWKDNPLKVHVLVTHEPLTNSAGDAIEIQSPGRPINRFSGR